MHIDVTGRARNSRRSSSFMAWVVAVGAVAPVLAAPTVQQVSGPLDHNSSITITGSGFGSKPTAAPVVWDNATGNSLSAKWDGAMPNAAPGYNTQYYAPMRGIDPPHSHVTRYIAGAHATNKGADSGYDVLVYKNVTLPAAGAPPYIYMSWYQRADNGWSFAAHAANTVDDDNNFKNFVYSVCCGAYEQPYWYTMYGPPHPASSTDTDVQWAINGQQLDNPDVNGHNAWWNRAVNPMAGKWSKVQVLIRVSADKDGYVKLWENGRLVIDYAGRTDNFPGNRRTLAIGGYARMQGHTNNWRYFDDLYVDTSQARVVLADKPVLSQASIIENQIPSSWSDGSITATVNLGQFTQGQTAYLFVVDANGNASATGTSVTAGGMVAVPSPPPSVSVR